MDSMIKDNEVDEIKELIQSGFDLELISFELDIPLEDIKQIKQKIDKQESTKKSKRYSYSEIVSNRNKEAHQKMQQMRERYKNLYFKSNKVDNVKQKQLTEEEIEIINSCITKIQNSIEEIRDISKYERRKNVANILEEVKKIQNYPLTIEQVEKLNILMDVEELTKSSFFYDVKNLKKYNLSNAISNIIKKINKYQRIIDRKLVEAIDIAQSQTEDLEELKALKQKITTEMEIENEILIGSVKSKINNKISKIQQSKALERIKNDIPKSILEIISNLANGTVDIEKAKKIIEEEAKKRVDSKPKTTFSLTEQQEKRQILIQIGTAIREKSDRFHVVNPETTIYQIQELCGKDLGQAVRIVVENLISRKDFEEAKRIYNKFSGKDKGDIIATVMKDLRLKIRNAEISDIVLKGINTQGTEEEEREYFELIEKGIKMENVKLRAISLGKSQDGTRNITLADIWTDENQKEKDVKIRGGNYLR